MAYCINCGNKLGEGARFCTNCGKPVPGAAAGKAVNSVQNLRVQPGPKKVRSYNVRNTDYSRLNNVCLVTRQSHHTAFHLIFHVASSFILIYILIVFFPVVMPLLTQPEGSVEIPYTPGMFPGLSLIILITIISGIAYRKTRYDIIHSLPKGFDYWKLRRMLRWDIFGLESLKTAALRLLGNKELHYPELGFGTDDEGNYYAFTVSGEDVEKYPPYESRR